MDAIDLQFRETLKESPRFRQILRAQPLAEEICRECYRLGWTDGQIEAVAAAQSALTESAPSDYAFERNPGPAGETSHA